VQRLARGAPLALGNLKRLMRTSFERSLDAQLDAERDAFLRCAASEDFREGTGAFLEKRPAQYQGRYGGVRFGVRGSEVRGQVLPFASRGAKGKP
jgi:hypothetical protein